MWGRTSRRQRTRLRGLVGPTTFPSRDWPTAPPAPPETPQEIRRGCRQLKNLIKAAPAAEARLQAAADAKPRPGPLSVLFSCCCQLLVGLATAFAHDSGAAHLRNEAATEEEDGGGDAAGRRRLLRGAQQADFAPHHRRRRGRLRRRRAVPRRGRRHAPPAGLLHVVAPCAAGWRIDVGATGLHAVPPRRQLRRRRRWQGVAATAAAAAAAEGHRRVHPPVHARRRALQAEGQELERLQGAEGGAGAGRGRRRGRHAGEETRLSATQLLSKIKKEKRATN